MSFLEEKSYDAERPDLINMLEIIKEDGRRQFQTILESSPKEDPEFSVVCEKVRGMDHLQTVVLAEGIFQKIDKLLPKRINPVDRVPVLIDIPSEPGSGNKLGGDIVVVNHRQEHDSVARLSQVSSIIKGVNDSFSEYLCRLRILLHPDIYPDTPEAKEEIRGHIRTHLIKTFA